jgi:NADH-quinone oxidoreductase subunit N
MIGGAPQLAAFAICIRLLVEGLLPLAFDWQQMLVVMAIGSLLVGNLAAVAQSNLKRMLAFSTISQMGFLLLGLLSGVISGNQLNTEAAYSASMFYALTYVLTTLAAFGIIMLLARAGHESEQINDLAGLNQRSPLYAGVMAMAMFSLAGLPPLVGFYAKLSVLQTLISSQQTSYIALAVFAVLMSLIGAFYYLRIVKVMYFDAPLASNNQPLVAAADARIVLTLNGALLLVLGVMPGGLMTLCSQAMSSIVKSLGA